MACSSMCDFSKAIESELDIAWKEIPNRIYFPETSVLNSESPIFLNTIVCNTITPDQVYMYIAYTLGTLANVTSFYINKTKAKIYIFGADLYGGGCVSCTITLMNNKTAEFRRKKGERTFASLLFSYFTEMMKYLENQMYLEFPAIPRFTLKEAFESRLPMTGIPEPTQEEINTGITSIVQLITSEYGNTAYNGCNMCNNLAIKQDEVKERFAKNHSLINALIYVSSNSEFSIFTLTIGIITLNTIATASSFPTTYKEMQESSKDAWNRLFSKKRCGDTYEFILYHRHIEKLQKLIDSL